MTAEEFRQRALAVLDALDEQYGELPIERNISAVYESDDGKYVLLENLTEFEHYEIDRQIFGQEVADFNARERAR